MAIYIGAYIPDKNLENSAFNNALITVAAKLFKLREHPSQKSTPHIDLNFLMPGKEETPGFEGMRLQSYDSTSQSLRVESVVPASIIDSIYAENYVIAAMLDALDNSSEFFDQIGNHFNTHEYSGLIDSLLDHQQSGPTIQ